MIKYIAGGASQRFNYTGTVQTVVLKPGRYQIECHGAKGGGQGNNGSKVVGIITLSKETTLYVHVGNMPTNNIGGWNGGTTVNNSSYKGGGGSTDVSLKGSSDGSTNWNNTNHLNSILIAASGGTGQGTIAGRTDFVGNADTFYFKDKVYQVVRTKMNWHNAENYCISIGGHLAMPKTKEYCDYVSYVATRYGFGDMWIGGRDNAVEGTWRWIDGTLIGYSNWNAGEPNNSGNEDYLEIYTASGKWNDLNGTQSYPFICELDLVMGGAGGGTDSYSGMTSGSITEYENGGNGYCVITNIGVTVTYKNCSGPSTIYGEDVIEITHDLFKKQYTIPIYFSYLKASIPNFWSMQKIKDNTIVILQTPIDITKYAPITIEAIFDTELRANSNYHKNSIQQFTFDFEKIVGDS